MQQNLISVLFVLEGFPPTSPLEKLAASYCAQGGKHLHRVNRELQPTIGAPLHRFNGCAAILERPFPNPDLARVGQTPPSAAQVPQVYRAQARGPSMPGVQKHFRPARPPPVVGCESAMPVVDDARVLQDWTQLMNLASSHPDYVAFGAEAVKATHEQGAISVLFLPRGHYPDVELLAPRMRAAGLSCHVIEEHHPLFAKVLVCPIAAILTHPVVQRKQRETPVGHVGADPGRGSVQEGSATSSAMPATARSSSAPEPLTAGRRVVAFGLIVAKELNGKSGVLKELDVATGQWQVEFGEGKVKALKADNLMMTASRGV